MDGGTSMSSQSPRSDQENQPAETQSPRSTHRETPTNEDTADSSGRDAGPEQIEEGPPDLSLDLIFDVLKNSRRRLVLQYLTEHDERVTLSDLAEHIAAIENDTTVQALSSQQRKRVYVGLYQCHLPKLDDMDVIEFNQSRGHVELGPTASQLDPYLFIDEDEDGPWYHHYVGFLAISALALAGTTATGLIGGIGAAVVFSGLSIGLLGLAAVHLYDQG